MVAEIVTNEQAGKLVCPRHGRCVPAQVSSRGTCLWCGDTLLRRDPPGDLRPSVEVGEVDERQRSWLIREVDADADLYDLDVDGKAVIYEQPLAAVEEAIGDLGHEDDEVIFEARDGYRVDHHFRDPPWS